MNQSEMHPRAIIASNYGDTAQQAANLIRGDRDVERGDPLPIYEDAAKIFTAWAGIPLNGQAMFKAMICVKMARMKHNPQVEDNYVDMIGYIDFLNYGEQKKNNK